MKQKFRLLLLLLAAMVLTQTVKAATTTTIDDGKLTYQATDGVATPYAKVTGYVGDTKPTGVLEIPATVTVGDVTYKVVAIADGTNVKDADGKSVITSAFYQCGAITSVVLPESITTIGKYAFQGCTNLLSINFPAKLTTISDNAFSGCTKLASVTLPEGLKTIKTNAFFKCEALTEVNIPASVTALGNSSFKNCTALADVTFNWDDAASVVTVGTTIFTSTPTIHVPEGSADAYSAWAVLALDGAVVDDVVDTVDPVDPAEPATLTYTYDDTKGTATVSGYTGTPAGELVIPATVENEGKTYDVRIIANSAFKNCTEITSVTLPEGLTTINGSSFNGCSKLSEVALPTTLKTIGDNAFLSCNKLFKIDIPSSVQAIGEKAFAGCSNMTNVYFHWTSDDDVITRAKDVFLNINRTASVLWVPRDCSMHYIMKSWGENFSDIKEYNVTVNLTFNYPPVTTDGTAEVTGYEGDKPSGTLEIPSKTVKDGVTYNVKNIYDAAASEDGAFRGCKDISKVVLPAGLLKIGKYAFQECSGISEIEFPASLKNISTNAFYNCSGLGTLAFPENLTNIGNSAFYGCSGMKLLNIPASITAIGNNAFKDCSGLESIYLNWTENVLQAPDDVLEGIAEGAIIYVPKGMVDEYIAKGWNLDKTTAGGSITIQEVQENSEYEGLKYTLDIVNKTASVTGYTDVSVVTGTLEIPSKINIGGITYNVTSIADATDSRGVFYKIRTLEKVILPEGLEVIGEYAFHDCENIQEVILPSTLKRIENRGLCDACRQMTDLKLPDGLEYIGEYAFRWANFVTLDIPESVTIVKNNAFADCNNLETLYLHWTEKPADKGTTYPTLKANQPTTIFKDIESQPTVYIPEGYDDIYAGTCWDTYSKFNGGTTTDYVAGVTSGELEEGKAYYSITIPEGEELNAEGKDINVGVLIIERHFHYTKATNKTQWFNLALPFNGKASSELVQVYREQSKKYEPAECKVDYVTFDYKGERRLENGPDGGNWDVLYDEGGEMSELIQFPRIGDHYFKFISPSREEAMNALKHGRVGDTFFDETAGSEDPDNGWNIIPAGKTYTTVYPDLKEQFASVQIYNIKKNIFTPQLTENPIKPYEVISMHLTAPYQSYTASPLSENSSAAKVEHYTLELVDAEGEMLDRIYLFDGSNDARYRVGKMGALKSGATQMVIRVNGGSYCTYSTLASEADKSYSVALTDCKDCSLVLKDAGSQLVSVDGSTMVIDSPVAVENGEVVIKIGSSTSGVEDVDGSLAVTGEYGYIAINGAAVGTQYMIANMGGMTTYGTTTDATTNVAVPAGVYAVKVADQIVKVIVK